MIANVQSGAPLYEQTNSVQREEEWRAKPPDETHASDTSVIVIGSGPLSYWR